MQQEEKVLIIYRPAEVNEYFVLIFFPCHVQVLPIPLQNQHSITAIAGETQGGKIRIMSLLRGRLHRKSQWTAPSLSFTAWQKRLSLPWICWEVLKYPLKVLKCSDTTFP